MKTFPCRILVVGWCAALLLVATGCVAQKVYEDPISVMNNSSDPTARMAAARQAEETHAMDPGRFTALNKMLWDWGHGDEERRYAIDQLLKLDETAFRKLLARRITMIKNPSTLRYVFEMAAEKQWQEFTPAIVRSYARTLVTGDSSQRPEIEALEKLNPNQPMVDIVFDVFANDQDDVSVHEQIAAWQLLWKISDYQTINTLLKKAPSTNPMVVDLKAAADDLHCLPVGREGYLRLAYLRKPEMASYWQEARTLVSGLSPQQQEGLELRHIPVLMKLDRQTRSLSREALISRLTVAFDAEDHYMRGPNFDGPMQDYPQRFAQAIDQLCWADLASMDLLFKIVKSPAVTRALFEQAAQDTDDTTSEHGGVLQVNADSMNAEIFSPMSRVHDLKFIPTNEMIESLYTNQAHYHFHAQSERNRDYAGPSMGDMRMARELETHCIVLTFIDHDTLNVDYYQPNGAVIDMGSIHR